MPKRPDHLRLVDLVEAAEGIVTRLAGISVEQFMDNEDLQESDRLAARGRPAEPAR